jgi:hypothetical protein
VTDDELRALVRDAVRRHLGGAAAEMAPPSHMPSAPARTASGPAHPSFARYILVRAADDTSCIVEPGVTCNHCGYCQCHGH